MIEPQSAQDGESALTLNATFVPPPRFVAPPSDATTAATAEWPPLPFPFVCPLPRTGIAGIDSCAAEAGASPPEEGANDEVPAWPAGLGSSEEAEAVGFSAKAVVVGGKSDVGE